MPDLNQAKYPLCTFVHRGYFFEDNCDTQYFVIDRQQYRRRICRLPVFTLLDASTKNQTTSTARAGNFSVDGLDCASDTPHRSRLRGYDWASVIAVLLVALWRVGYTLDY
jgi:hypothetical protein